MAIPWHSNIIGDEGAKNFAGALPHCDELQCLDLSCTGVGDEGASILAQVILR